MLDSLWTKERWEEVRNQLETLSLEELRLLATRTGIAFAHGNASVQDTKALTAKEQFILALDESLPDELSAELERIIRTRGK